MPMRYFSYNNGWCGLGAFFPGPLGFIVTLLFWAGILFLAVKLFQTILRPKSPTGPSALDILKDRYARGEIGQQDFERMKRDVTN